MNIQYITPKTPIHPTWKRWMAGVKYTPRPLGEKQSNPVFDWSKSDIKGYSRKTITVERPDDMFRFHDYADKLCSSIQHTGWYTDHHQDGKTRGVVFLLKHGRYLAACTDPWNWDEKHDCGPVMFDCTGGGRLEIYTSERDAALAADGLAQRWAEFCREDDAVETAKADIEFNLDEIKRLKDERMDFIRQRDRESESISPTALTLYADKIESLKRDIVDLRKRNQKLKENYWLAVEGR